MTFFLPLLCTICPSTSVTVGYLQHDSRHVVLQTRNDFYETENHSFTRCSLGTLKVGMLLLGDRLEFLSGNRLIDLDCLGSSVVF